MRAKVKDLVRAVVSVRVLVGPRVVLMTIAGFWWIILVCLGERIVVKFLWMALMLTRRALLFRKVLIVVSVSVVPVVRRVLNTGRKTLLHLLVSFCRASSRLLMVMLWRMILTLCFS